MKLYMIWDEISNRYFSEVAKVTREDVKDNSYVYDKKHATKVLEDILDTKRMLQDLDVPDELKMPVNIMLKEVSIDDVPISDYIINKTWELKIRHGYPFMKALRLCKYEQVRRFNDYIDFDPHTPSHQYIYIHSVF